MKDALQVEEAYLNDIHDAMGNCTFDCVQMSLLHLYTEAARRVLDFIDDDREEIIRFLGNGILSPVAVCIRSNNNLEPSFVVRACVIYHHHPRLSITVISMSSDISV